MTMYRVYVQCTAGAVYEIDADSYNQAKVRSENLMIKEIYSQNAELRFDWSNFTAVEIEKIEIENETRMSGM